MIEFYCFKFLEPVIIFRIIWLASPHTSLSLPPLSYTPYPVQHVFPLLLCGNVIYRCNTYHTKTKGGDEGLHFLSGVGLAQDPRRTQHEPAAAGAHF